LGGLLRHNWQEMVQADPAIRLQDLIRDARGGDAVAFDVLLGPLVEPAFRFAVSMLGDSQEAEDAVQEAAVRAWLRLGQLRVGAALRPWFFAIVANQCRSVRRRPWWSVIRLAELRLSAPYSEETTVNSLDLDRALAELPAEDRAILHLRFYQDLPVADVARCLGISTGAAKVRLHRAARRLRPGLSMEDVIQ
jgi:RNA polymerase sigma-70 factor, ECF subfamily